MSDELFAAEEQGDEWTDKEAYDWLRKAGYHLKVADQRVRLGFAKFKPLKRGCLDWP